MSRLQSLHSKTAVVVNDGELPFNPKNIALTDADLREILAKGGLRDLPYRNINVYRTAFVHKSYVAMKRDGFADANEHCPPGCLPLQQVPYERLEFLGDSVLGCVVASYLFSRFLDQDEGFMSRMRTKLVNGKMLASLASQLGLNRFAIISKQCEASGGRDTVAVCEDIFEAFIGAIITDFNTDSPDSQITLSPSLRSTVSPLSGAGFQIAEQWITNVIEEYVDFADMVAIHTNHKELLVKHMAQTGQDAPRLSEVSINMRRGKKEYTYSVRNRAGAIIGTGFGQSRKDAENDACREALTKHYGLTNVRSQS
jgi:ribonuclease-3